MPELSNNVRTYRRSQLRNFMHLRGFNALAFMDAAWFEWLTNQEMNDQSWERPFIALVPYEGPVCVASSSQSRNHFEAACARGAYWVDATEYYVEAPSGRAGEGTHAQWATIVADLLSSAGLAAGRVGVDSFSARLDEVARVTPSVEFIASGDQLKSLRWVKHSEELANMSAAAELSDWIMDAYQHRMEPTTLLAELDFDMAAKLSVRAAERFGGENFRITSMSTMSGPMSACPKGDGTLTGHRLQNNTTAMTTIATRLNGAAVELARTWLIGEPDASIINMHDAARIANAAAVAVAVADKPVSGIHEAAREVFQRFGLAEHFKLRAGHGIGVAIHDFPENLPFESRMLLENETYAIEPSLFVAGVGAFRFADTVLVGRESAHKLTHSTRVCC